MNNTGLKISNITINKVNELMKNLSDKERIFQNESQFQFELAVLIKEEWNFIIERPSQCLTSLGTKEFLKK